MSFYVNDVAVQAVGFNGNKVNSVYYNNTFVWEAPEVSEWASIQELCKQRQSGEISAFPASIYLGMEVEIKITGVDLPAKARLVDIETEGPGILIFQVCQLPYKYLNFAPYTELSVTNPSTAACFGSQTNVYPYIRPLTKITYRSGEIREDLYFWNLSDDEIGEGKTYDKEYTAGRSTPYPWLATKANRICYDKDGNAVQYYLRTYAGKDSKGRQCCKGIYSSGSYSGNDSLELYFFELDHYQFPCFAIG